MVFNFTIMAICEIIVSIILIGHVIKMIGNQ